MSQLVFSIHQNPEEIGFNASEKINLPARVKSNRQKASVLLSCPLYGLPTEGVAQIKGGSCCLKGAELKVSLTTLNNLLKKKYP